MDNLKNQPSFILIGPGNLGLSITSLLHERGFQCVEVVARTSEGWEGITEWMGPNVDITEWNDWVPHQTDFILIATPDDLIGEISRILSTRYKSAGIHEGTAIHFSGIQNSDEGTSLRKIGIQVSSLHPLQTVPNVENGRQALLGCSWAIEGDNPELCRKIVAALQGTAIMLKPENKVTYHLAAVFASNLMVALEGMAIDIAGEAGISREEFFTVFPPLIQHSLKNIIKRGPERSITGPVKRADTTTIQKHLQWLNQADEKYKIIYRELSHYLMEVLLAEEVITLQDVEQLTQVLDEE